MATDAKPIMLIGTSAPRRRQLMADAFAGAYELHFHSPDIDEKQYRATRAAELTGLIAHAKMDAVVTHLANENPALAAAAAARPGSVAVTFDQVVVWHGEIREKPVDAAEAKRFITGYSADSLGTTQTTCVCNLNTTKTRTSEANETVTYYKELPDDLIDCVVARGECLHTAGAFVVEDTDMHSQMIKVDPGTEAEVQGVSVRAVRACLARLSAASA